jgi:LysR family transcriptional activator of nhaA
MPSLKYHQLYYFWTVAREGSIARATRKLHLTQPTISGQLRELERTMGERLFAKSGRNLVLTEMGHTVFRYADEIFTLGREMMETVQGRPTGRPLRFAVGISDSLPKLTTYRLIRPALERPDPFRLVFRIDKTERLLADLSIHALDLVLADVPAPPTVKVRAFSHLLGESDVTVFGTEALAERFRPGFPRSLHGAPLLLQTENTALRRSLDGWFAEEGITPEIVAEVEDVALLQVLGQQGMGLFAAPSVVEADIRSAYRVATVGRLERVRERFYAISVERRITHPAVIAISEAARSGFFGAEERGDPDPVSPPPGSSAPSPGSGRS